MADIIYKKGQSSNLDNVQIKEGQILVTEDTGEMYVDVTNSDRKKINSISNSKSGSMISVNDVSPIEHNIYVTLRNKNLWNKTYGANESNWEILDNYYYVLPIKVGKGNIVTVSYKNELTENGLGFFTAVMTERSNATDVTTWLYHNANSSAYTKRVVTLTATEENIYIRTSIPSKGGLGSNAFASFVKYINDTLQIELGTTETNYTPYLTDFSSVSVIKSGLNLWWGNTTDNPQFDGKGYIEPDGKIINHTSRVFRIPIKDTLKYNISRNDGKELGIILRYEDKNKKFISVDTSGYSQPYYLYTPPENASYLLFSASEVSGNILCFSIAESANNNWEEPKMGQTAITNTGDTVKGLTSLSPNMTLMADTDGVIIDCEYLTNNYQYVLDNRISKQVQADWQQNDDFSNSLKSTKSGAVITADDVSPLEHSLKVKLTSDTVTDFSGVSVTRKGMNFFNPAENFDASYKDYVSLDDDVFTMSTPLAQLYINNYKTVVTPAGKYTITLFPLEDYSDFNVFVYFYNKDGGETSLSTGTIGTAFGTYSYTFTAYEDFILSIGGAYGHLYSGERKFRVMLEEGAVDNSKYSVFVEPQTVVANKYGTVEGLTSASPMTLYSDNDEVIIHCEYNKDINSLVDQAYKPTSENAASGKAIADAISQIELPEIDTSNLVGEITSNGGEIFNLYEDTMKLPKNKAGEYAHAEGVSTDATGRCAHAEGVSSQAIGEASHAENGAQAKGYYSHAEGVGFTGSLPGGDPNTQNGSFSHAEGQGKAYGQRSHAENSGSAKGVDSHAENNATASGPSSHAEGQGTATGQSSHAEGMGEASGNTSHAENNGWAIGLFSHAEGSTEAHGKYSHSEGYGSYAIGEGSHAENQSTASGYHSHAENDAIAAGIFNHAENAGQTTSTAQRAHAENQGIAEAIDSHAEGTGIAKHTCSHAGGWRTETGRTSQTVIGKYNKITNDALFIVGDGDDANRKHNAFEVKDDGSAILRTQRYSYDAIARCELIMETCLQKVNIKATIDPDKDNTKTVKIENCIPAFQILGNIRQTKQDYKGLIAEVVTLGNNNPSYSIDLYDYLNSVPKVLSFNLENFGYNVNEQQGEYLTFTLYYEHEGIEPGAAIISTSKDLIPVNQNDTKNTRYYLPKEYFQSHPNYGMPTRLEIAKGKDAPQSWCHLKNITIFDADQNGKLIKIPFSEIIEDIDIVECIYFKESYRPVDKIYGNINMNTQEIENFFAPQNMQSVERISIYIDGSRYVDYCDFNFTYYTSLRDEIQQLKQAIISLGGNV